MDQRPADAALGCALRARRRSRCGRRGAEGGWLEAGNDARWVDRDRRRCSARRRGRLRLRAVRVRRMMRRSDGILLAAVAASLALHIAALFGTPRFDLGRLYEDVRPAPPIEVRIAVRAEPPPAKIVAAKPVRRPARKPAPTPAPPAAKPPVLATQSLLDAPSPDGDDPVPEARAPAENGPTEGASTLAEQATPELLAEDAPRTDYPLKRARLVYDLLYMNRPNGGEAATKIGHVTHTWSQDGERYEAESVAEAVGLVWLFLKGKVVQRSTGGFDGDGLRAAAYHVRRVGRR